MDVSINNASKQGHTPEQGEDVKMIEAPEEGSHIDELDYRIFES